ncbi:hypothetical protein PHLGIDRAFT_169220 [Phlebiopsis gigantea 11061_1 CR5-6]|uniref:Uncharacterized protein n=1 Tax=Phlebiopsis gigantea (strain 11061_1 CR5-6) TaxID=745531 RepID=A0A0C3S4K8_PHLG1|nr:hypothetical protein PHLGIDRAFT_169220 [Phlebiopsis gigantea 11061_1 CR5-6]
MASLICRVEKPTLHLVSGNKIRCFSDQGFASEYDPSRCTGHPPVGFSYMWSSLSIHPLSRLLVYASYYIAEAVKITRELLAELILAAASVLVSQIYILGKRWTFEDCLVYKLLLCLARLRLEPLLGMSSTAPVVVSDTFLGPCLIGIFLNVGLYGITVAQTQTYYTIFRKDPKWLKIYVAILFIADTMNAVYNATWIYRIVIPNYGKPNASAQLTWCAYVSQSSLVVTEGYVNLCSFSIRTISGWNRCHDGTTVLRTKDPHPHQE